MEASQKRIFVAIAASGQIQKKFLEFKQKHSGLPLDWHEPKNLHITLLPPVEIEVEDLERLYSTLADFEWDEPFEIIFNQVAAGPDPEKPRLLWTTGEVSPEISILKQKLEKLVNYKPDRQFQMHITLARFRADEVHNTAIHNFSETIHWHMLVDRFVVMESHFNGTKADYRILKEFSFYG